MYFDENTFSALDFFRFLEFRTWKDEISSIRYLYFVYYVLCSSDRDLWNRRHAVVVENGRELTHLFVIQYSDLLLFSFCWYIYVYICIYIHINPGSCERGFYCEGWALALLCWCCWLELEHRPQWFGSRCSRRKDRGSTLSISFTFASKSSQRFLVEATSTLSTQHRVLC